MNILDELFVVRFYHRDETDFTPVEEYWYSKKNDAEYHFELFRDDDSELYTHIDLALSESGKPDVVLQRISFY